MQTITRYNNVHIIRFIEQTLGLKILEESSKKCLLKYKPLKFKTVLFHLQPYNIFFILCFDNCQLEYVLQPKYLQILFSSKLG